DVRGIWCRRRNEYLTFRTRERASRLARRGSQARRGTTTAKRSNTLRASTARGALALAVDRSPVLVWIAFGADCAATASAVKDCQGRLCRPRASCPDTANNSASRYGRLAKRSARAGGHGSTGDCPCRPPAKVGSRYPRSLYGREVSPGFQSKIVPSRPAIVPLLPRYPGDG